MLAGCETSGSVGKKRTLPSLPAYVAPVNVVEPKESEDARLVAARERAGRVEANQVIASVKTWYAGVVQSYGDGR